MHDVSRGSMPNWWILISFGIFIPGAPNDFFSVKFVERSKYCLEISNTRETLACSVSSILSFEIVERQYEKWNREDLFTASEYWKFFFFY